MGPEQPRPSVFYKVCLGLFVLKRFIISLLILLKGADLFDV